MKKHIDPLQSISDFIRAASLEDTRRIAQMVNYRMDTFRLEKKRELSISNIVAFTVNKRYYTGRILLGKITQMRQKRAVVGCPGDSIWAVPVTQLKLATPEQIEKYESNLKTFGEPRPPVKRKSRDRQLLESLFGR